jgi:hypothetical protein
MKANILKILGISVLITAVSIYGSRRENSFQKASLMKLTGNAELRFSKTKYNTNFKTISVLDEIQINNSLKSIHQITEKISKTVISNSGDVMLTLAKSVDNDIVVVVFKNQQIQMIQKVLKLTETRIEFQYGAIEFLPEDSVKLAYSSNIELEF